VNSITRSPRGARAVISTPAQETAGKLAPLRDKTLAVRAAPANPEQSSGSALTIDDQRSHFDGIVFGELAEARWMAGSDFHHRTNRNQDAVPAETANAQTFVPVAIVYRGREISLYRNGALLSPPVTGHTDFVPPASRPQLQRIAGLPGESAEIRVVISRAEAARKMFGFVLFADGKGGGLPVMLLPETGRLRVGKVEAPFAVSALPPGEDVELRIFVDKYLVEVFANDRQALLTAQLEHAGQRGLEAFSVGAPTTLKRVDIWPLSPVFATGGENRKFSAGFRGPNMAQPL